MSQSHVINPWPRFRIGDVARVQSGYAFKSEWFVPDGVRLLRNVNVSQGRVVWDDSAFLPPNRREEFSTFELSEGDIVLSLDRPVVSGGLKVARITERDLPALLLQRVGRFIVQAEVVPDYLYFFLQSVEFIRAITAHDQSLGVPHVSPRQVEEVELPLPPLAEQRRIAGRLREQLAEVAKARTAMQAQLAAAQALPAASLRAVFQSPVADAWPTELLGDVTRIGAGVTLGRDLRGRETRLVPYLRVANVKDSWLDLSDVKEVEATEREIEDCQLRYGDLLLTEGGDRDKLGRGMYWQDQLPECIHQNHIFRVRFDLTNFDPDFVSLQVSSEYGKAFFLAHAKQTTGIATINRGVLTRFPLRTPPLADQRTIATRLAAELAEVTRLRESLSGKLETLDRLPAALLAQAFQGGQ